MEYRASINSSGVGTAQYSYYSYLTIGGHAQLSSVQINDGRRRTVTYSNDMNGQVIRRDEADLNTSTGDPHEVWYRFGGKEMGHVTNNGTQSTRSYHQSIAERQVAPGTGPFRNGASLGLIQARFDASVDQITSYNQGSSSGGYTVRAGETLSSIAASLWGDASLWYRLAQANGLSGEAALMEGQSLRIPAGVMKNTHNASTYRPYDPAETIGDTAILPQRSAARSDRCTNGLLRSARVSANSGDQFALV